MKVKKLISIENNSAVYNKLYRRQIETYDYVCRFCPLHRGENSPFGSSDHKSWKSYRRKQYRYPKASPKLLNIIEDYYREEDER